MARSRPRRAETPAPWLRYIGAEAPAQPRSLGGRRVRCALLAHHLDGRGWATRDELLAFWPGGVENPTRDLDAYDHCLFNYARFMGRAEDRYVESDAATAIVRRAVADALADKPEHVELTTGRVAVYPKSYHALETLDALDGAIELLTGVDYLEAARIDGDITALIGGRALRSLSVRTWAWIVTHPLAGLPYAEHDDDPAHPAWTSEIAIDDVLALWNAHRRVNRRRNAILLRSFPKDPAARPSRLGLDGFLGTYIGSKALGEFDVLRRWPLGRVFATAVSEALTADEARQRSEADRARAGSGTTRAA